eukprot:5164490-Pleurochrysis_carterae.AAC.1
MRPTSNRGTEAYYLVNTISEAPLFECEPTRASMPRQALSTGEVRQALRPPSAPPPRPSPTTPFTGPFSL